MTALWEIGQERDEIDAALTDAEGELTPDIEARLAALDMKFDEKVEKVARYVKHLEAEAVAIGEELTRLTSRKQARLNKANGLIDYLVREMSKYGRDRVESPIVTVAFQKNPPSVKGDVDAKALWEAGGDFAGFVKYTPESFALDRRVVLQAHKAGQAIPKGLDVVQTTSLRIR